MINSIQRRGDWESMSAEPVFIKLSSRPYRCRSGLIPLAMAMTTGWIFVGLWAWVACLTVPYNHIWAIFVSASDIAFAVILWFMSSGIIRDSWKEYAYELNSTETILTVFDRLNKRKSATMMLMDDVQYAEYYPYTDSACLILHSADSELELPLWPLGRQSQDVLDFLVGRGIKIMNVQMDDKVPS